MELMEAIRSRHSVRQYTDKPIPPETLAALAAEVSRCNEAGGIHIQRVYLLHVFKVLGGYLGYENILDIHLCLLTKVKQQIQRPLEFFKVYLVCHVTSALTGRIWLHICSSFRTSGSSLRMT